MHLRLSRIESNDKCTRGALTVDGKAVCVTLENPWIDNKPNISCIPAGIYGLKPFSGNKYKDVYQIMDVPGRTYILMHIGNIERNTNGCVLSGSYYGELAGEPAVLNSGKAMGILRDLLKNDSHTIEIINCF